MRRILRKIVAGEGDQLGDLSSIAEPSVVNHSESYQYHEEGADKCQSRRRLQRLRSNWDRASSYKMYSNSGHESMGKSSRKRKKISRIGPGHSSLYLMQSIWQSILDSAEISNDATTACSGNLMAEESTARAPD